MEDKIEATGPKFQTWLKEVKAGAECGRGTASRLVRINTHT
jgi:hypothetical protein